MEISKDIHAVEISDKISAAIYIYSILFKERSHHLSDSERKTFSELLLTHVSGGINRGDIAKISGGYKYEYIKRIKKAGWMKKEGNVFHFPPDSVLIAEAIYKGDSINFHAKVNGG